MDPLTVVLGVSLGVLVGIVTGSMGVGGGVVLVPSLVLLMGVEQHLAQGISLLAMMPAALAGAITHYRQKNVIISIGLALGLTSVAAAVVGALIAGMLDAAMLRRVFGVFLVIISLRMMFGK